MTTEYTAPPPPPPGSPGLTPEVTPSPETADSAAAGESAPDPIPVAPGADSPADITVRAMAGIPLPPYGVLHAGQVVDVGESPLVRDRIAAGYLRVVTDADAS